MLFSNMTKLFKLKYVKRIDLFYIAVNEMMFEMMKVGS